MSSGGSERGPRTPVAIGPLPASSVLVWAETASRTIQALREQPELGVPEDVIEEFERYLHTWWDLAAAGETFRWEDDVEVGAVRRLASYWALLANAARSEAHPTGVEPAPAAAQPFYDALVIAMTEVLAVEDPDSFADTFEEVAPAFEPEVPTLASADRLDRPTTVLLVDDTEDIRLLYRIALESHPEFAVVGEAANGEEALAAVAAGCPDAILLDVMMPVMDGLTALPLLHERCPGARITVISAGLTTEVRGEAISNGAVAVVDKQTSLDDLKRLLAG